jgi:hypothetical protein
MDVCSVCVCVCVCVCVFFFFFFVVVVEFNVINFFMGCMLMAFHSNWVDNDAVAGVRFFFLFELV